MDAFKPSSSSSKTKFELASQKQFRTISVNNNDCNQTKRGRVSGNSSSSQPSGDLDHVMGPQQIKQVRGFHTSGSNITGSSGGHWRCSMMNSTNDDGDESINSIPLTRANQRNSIRINKLKPCKTSRSSSISRRYSSCLSPLSVNLLVSLAISISILSTSTSRLTEAQQPIVDGQLRVSAANSKLPDLVSSTSDEPIVALSGQDAFVACVAKNLQNYTIIWRYTNEANAPGRATAPISATSALSDQIGATKEQQQQGDELGIILTAGRQRVISDDRFSVIQSHDTWLLKINNVRLSDTGTYICHTNSEPKVRVLRILSVLKPNQTPSIRDTTELVDSKGERNFNEIDYNFTDCCRSEFVSPRCQRLCSFQQLASRFQSINIVHQCYSNLPSITRCMVAGRNNTDCCQKRHIPSRCNSLCGHLGDTSSMSVQDQSFCADYSASIMSCVAEGISTLPGQPELVIVEAVSSTTLKVSWQKVTDEKEMRKIDGLIINLTKLSSFEDSITKSSSSPDATTPTDDVTKRESPRVSSSFSSSSLATPAATTTTTTNTGSVQPLASLTIVDVMNNSSLQAMSKLLAASSGTISLKLDKHNNEFSIDNLRPYTVYQIQMFAFNSLGRSQLTDPIRALTLAPENEQSPTNSGELSSGDAYVEPNLPDTRKCCLDRGVTLKRCLDTLCDPVEADRATIADLMICAPWSNVTFSCLSSRVNHTDCCKSRGVTPFCLSMCAGDIKRVDYRHFRCLTHMSTYTNCILETHNVLPSRPLNFTVGPITHSWAVLNWKPPKKHARSLQGYRIFWRRLEPVVAEGNGSLARGRLMGDQSPIGASSSSVSGSGNNNNNEDFLYSSAEAATNPYLLDALQPDTVYETFVVAVNRFGQSESSARFVFQTLADPEQLVAAQQNSGLGKGDVESRLPLHGNTKPSDNGGAQTYYNETSCCITSGVHSSCQQLCDYDLRVNDVSSLVTNCNNQMPVILRCMAGSRNSVPCCRNRGVSDHCLNVCAGLTEHSPLVVATRCAPDFGKIIRCMDEGSKQIPSAPVDLHTLEVAPDRVQIKWAPAAEDSLRTDVEYHVRYQQLQQTPDQPLSASDLSALIAVVPLHPLEHNLIMTTNQTQATIDKLKPNSRYSIYVTAENSYGISLPSLVLVLQTPDESSTNMDEFKRRATLGAPHSLEILRSDTESLVLKWIAPLFTSSDSQIRYRIFYKMIASQANLSNNGSGSGSDQTSTSPAPQTTTATSTLDQAQPIQQLSSNWTILETGDTSIVLRNLRYSSQYVITVQAFSKQMLGHMSEILLAATAKPIPPTLNHPLVINNPVEGNNITIMCVALGQPIPQISMFINGLLVQKRTQPYVIYHLVNLVRGQLIITCFASNGQGKDYVSVQSRTEVSVKFPSKAVARLRESTVNYQSIARLSCEISGNPQPTVIWTFEPQQTTQSDTTTTHEMSNSDNSNSKLKVLTPSDRLSTLLVSQFENPFTWTHTLTIKNVSQVDAGNYHCRSRNILSESMDTIKLSIVDKITAETFSQPPSAANSDTNNPVPAGQQLSTLKQLEQSTDLMECCRSQNVSSKCLPACSPDGLDIETAFRTMECQNNLDKLMYCAADGSDHRNCCRSKQVPSSCLRWCSGAKLNIPALCFLSSAMDINQCFQEGRSLLPGPPRNVRVLLASESEHGELINQMDNQIVATTTSSMNSAGMFAIDKLMNSNGGGGGSDTTSSNNNNSNSTSSVISSMVMMMGDHNNHVTSSGGSGGNDPSVAGGSVANSGLADSESSNQQQQQQQQQTSEPLIIEWDPPAKNPQLVQFYRIFWRPFGSRELSRTVTNMTWIKLNDLNMNRIYEFVVKAANVHGSSVYSDPLTVKPVEILAQSNSIGTAGLIWFMPSSGNGAASLFGRVIMAISFATMFMFGSLALVMFLEKRGYLKRFASSKSNSSRISFANPAYVKDADGNPSGDNITWDSGHSLDILTPPAAVSTAASSPRASSEVPTGGKGQSSDP